MSSLKADFFLEEKVNLQQANSEPKSVPPPPRVLLTHYNVIILLAFILFTFLTFTNNAFSQPMLTNQPNPFNDQTEISYKIHEAGNVVVNVSSIHGEIVASYNQGNQEAGIYNIQFDGSSLLGGVYILDLIYENQRVQSIMILIK